MSDISQGINLLELELHLYTIGMPSNSRDELINAVRIYRQSADEAHKVCIRMMGRLTDIGECLRLNETFDHVDITEDAGQIAYFSAWVTAQRMRVLDQLHAAIMTLDTDLFAEWESLHVKIFGSPPSE